MNRQNLRGKLGAMDQDMTGTAIDWAAAGISEAG
jgi:hypothetical protein